MEWVTYSRHNLTSLNTYVVKCTGTECSISCLYDEYCVVCGIHVEPDLYAVSCEVCSASCIMCSTAIQLLYDV